MKLYFNTAALGLSLLAAQVAYSHNINQSPFDNEAVNRAVGAKEPAGLRTVADKALQSLVASLSAQYAREAIPANFVFDVSDVKSLKSATLGMAFEVYSAAPQALMNAKTRFDQQLVGTGIWNFMVMVNGRAVGLVGMEKIQGNWEFSSAGAAKLANDVQQSSQRNAGKQGFRFVRIYQATSDFLEVKNDQGELGYAPLIAARATLQLASPFGTSSGADASSAQDILPKIQAILSKNIAK